MRVSNMDRFSFEKNQNIITLSIVAIIFAFIFFGLMKGLIALLTSAIIFGVDNWIWLLVVFFVIMIVKRKFLNKKK